MVKNNSIVDPDQWEWTVGRTFLSIILTPIVLGAIFGNLLVLYVFITRPRALRLPTHYFIANLSLADFLVGVLAMPFLAVLQITNRWYFGLGYCSAWIIIHFWLCSSSILSTMAVCIERYIGVKYPHKHLSILSPKRIGIACTAVWVTAGALTLSSVFIWPEPSGGEGPFECRINTQIGHVIVVTVGVLYIPAIVMIVFYWQIYRIASEHIKTHARSRAGMQAHACAETSFSDTTTTSTGITSSTTWHVDEESQENENPGPKSKKSPAADFETKSKKQIILAKRLTLLVGVLLGSYIPFFTVFLIRAFDPTAVSVSVFSILGWIRYSNSCLNPFIYAFAIPAYRKAFESIAKDIKSKFSSISLK